MKKLLYLCLTCLFVYTSTAQAKVEFVAREGTSFAKQKTYCTPPYQNVRGVCVFVCDAGQYPFTTKPDETKGAVDEPCRGYKIRYRYKSCHPGYEWNASKTNCVIKDCSTFLLSKNDLEDGIGTIESCQTQSKTTYKYTSCNNGWELDAAQGNCIPQSCPVTLYPHDSSDTTMQPSKEVGEYETCQAGHKTYWGYVSCLNPDDVLENGNCFHKCTGFTSNTSDIPNCDNVLSCRDKNLVNHYKCANPSHSRSNASDTPSEENDALLTNILEKFRSIMGFSKGGKIETELKNLYQKAMSESQTLRTRKNFPVVLDYYEGGKEDKQLAKEVMVSWLFAMTLTEVDPTKRNELYKAGYVVGRDEPTYGRDFNSDLNVSRLVASIIFSKHHDFDKIREMRKEIGSSMITYKADKSEVYIDLQSFMPPAPGPYLDTHKNRTGTTPAGSPGGYPGGEANEDHNLVQDKKIFDYIVNKYSLPASNATQFTEDNQRAIQAVADNEVDRPHLFGKPKTTKDTYRNLTLSFNPVFGKHNIGVEISEEKVAGTNKGAIAKLVRVASKMCSSSRNTLLSPQYGRRRPGQGDQDQTSNPDKKARILSNYAIKKCALNNANCSTIEANSTYDSIENQDRVTGVKATSYPSGHSTYIWCAAMVLTEVMPDRAGKIMQAANDFANSRTIARYHWTSDTIQGRVIGSSFMPILHALTNKDYSNISYVNVTYEELLKEAKKEYKEIAGSSVDPDEPDPQEPDPQEPDPQEPDPQEPDPQEPDPQEPDPQEPDPQEPDPQEPDPQEPDPQEPDTQVTDQQELGLEPTDSEFCQKACGPQYVKAYERICVDKTNQITGVANKTQIPGIKGWGCWSYITPQELCQQGCGGAYTYSGGKLCKDATNETTGVSKTEKNTKNARWTCQSYEVKTTNRGRDITPEELCKEGCGSNYTYTGGKMCVDKTNINKSTKTNTSKNTRDAEWTCLSYIVEKPSSTIISAPANEEGCRSRGYKLIQCPLGSVCDSCKEKNGTTSYKVVRSAPTLK